jgi:hypothetical protein
MAHYIMARKRLRESFSFLTPSLWSIVEVITLVNAEKA